MNDTCIIVANGPSLNDVPMGFLQKYPSWGVNKIFMKEHFKPTYYVTVHENMLPFKDEIMALGAEMYITDRIAEHFPGAHPIHSIKQKVFSTKRTVNVWEGWSVIYVCLQIAYWHDFRTALLVGLDHDYTNGCFHPDYYKDTHTDPHDQDKLLPAFKLAKQYWEADGRRILNLTTYTKEPVFQKASLAEWYPSLLWG